VRPLGLAAREEPLATRLLAAPLVPLAWAYGAGARLHRALHRRGLRREARLPCRVACVGSLVAGGAGKTPGAAWLASALARRGHRVALASGGHGGRRRERVLVVSDGRRVYAGGAAAGDEALVLAAHAPGVPVLVARDRALAGLRALALFGTETLVLDDGFQHHRLRRNLDVVLLDARIGLGNGWPLPRGPLREPADAVRYADAVGVVDGDLVPEEEAVLARFCPGALRFRARRRPAALRPLAAGPAWPPAEPPASEAWARTPAGLRGAEVGILAGIARPASLRHTLESLGARVVAERRFPDHHRYRRADLEGIARQARTWITTEKDAPKLHPAWVSGAELLVLAIELEVENEPTVLDWIEARLR
jgi:tetraacyldisaccharide 4'-kinase